MNSKLLPHEKDLLKAGALIDVSHPGAKHIWLRCDSAYENNRISIYRHMGDIEFKYLLENNQLPSTQPYQTITKGEEGRRYCEKYLKGFKKVNTSITTIVEFMVDKNLIDKLFSIQSKIEDGTISHGLGSKAGRTLDMFNKSLKETTTWKIVMVKR